MVKRAFKTLGNSKFLKQDKSVYPVSFVIQRQSILGIPQRGLTVYEGRIIIIGLFSLLDFIYLLDMFRFISDSGCDQSNRRTCNNINSFHGRSPFVDYRITLQKVCLMNVHEILREY